MSTKEVYDQAAFRCEERFEIMLNRLWRSNMQDITLQAPGMERKGVINHIIKRFRTKGWHVEPSHGAQSGTWLRFTPTD